MNLNNLLEEMDKYIKSERYEDMLDKFFYGELSTKLQEPIDTPNEFTSNDIPKLIKNGELFTQNKNYLKDERNFMLLDDGGDVLVTVNSNGEPNGTNRCGSFSFPLDSEESKKAFAVMLLYLQQECHAVKFPKFNFNAD